MRTFILLVLCFAYGPAGGLTQKGIGNEQPQIEGGVGGQGGVSGPGGQGGVGGSSGTGGVGGVGGSGGIGGLPSTGSGGDLFMLLIHQIIQVNGMDPMRVPNQQLPFSKKFLVKTYRGQLFTYGTVMYGLHNLVRTGPCFVTVDDNGMRLGLNLGISHVFANSSATIKFENGEKHKVRVLAYVRRARAVLEISQVSATQVEVTNFKIKELRGFDLRLRPVGQAPKQFRHFLRAVQTFVELTVKRRLEPLFRDAANVQIKRLLFELSQQARSKPRPQDVTGLPPRSREDIPDVGNDLESQSGGVQNKL